MPTPDGQHARPIPVSRGPEAGDDVYVVDTRNRGRRPGGRGRAAAAPQPSHAPTAGAYDELGRPVRPRAAPRPSAPPDRGAPRDRRRRWVSAVLVVAVAWLAFLVATPVHAWSQVAREDTNPSGDRPAAGDGHTYLLVGSDSRERLTAAERKALGVGSGGPGRRTDSIILVHTSGGSGRPVLISVPRDSYLRIPGHGRNKVNAAFSIGGPKLLSQTLEQATGIPIDGYVEIGFGGFAGVVDSLGGVDVCVKRDMNDKKAHINLRKGCQSLDGKTALGYVRARYSDPEGDLGRAERQRQFLGAVMKKAATPATVGLPWRWWGFTHTVASSVTVGQDTSLVDTYRILSTMRKVSSGEALSLVVPLASTNTTTRAGNSVIWDEERARSLFTMLREGTPLDAPPEGTNGIPSGSGS